MLDTDYMREMTPTEFDIWADASGMTKFGKTYYAAVQTPKGEWHVAWASRQNLEMGYMRVDLHEPLSNCILWQADFKGENPIGRRATLTPVAKIVGLRLEYS